MRAHLFSALIPALFLFGCAHAGKYGNVQPPIEGKQSVSITEPVELKLKADPARDERVTYLHTSNSKAYENGQLRKEQNESLEFRSLAKTVNVEPANSQGVARFTQIITIEKKDGPSDLHDFAMPELGEKLEVTADSRGKIIKAGDYPDNSIFYVPPISLPEGKVAVGDTWVLQANWLSLGEMIPYRLDMVSILKGFWKCGDDTCAEVEVSGDVTLEGAIKSAMKFESIWKGTLYFAMNAGTVVWSRTDSEEHLVIENVKRDSVSCLESVLNEPKSLAMPGLTKPTCQAAPR